MQLCTLPWLGFVPDDVTAAPAGGGDTAGRAAACRLAAALKEYGALRRTIYAARYLAWPDYRRKIGRQLNKGESMHALRRDVFYAHEGAIRRVTCTSKTTRPGA